jgi:hypothetical protein
LLDQQNRNLALGRKAPDGPLDILDDRRLDAFGRLVEREEFRVHRQRPPDRELLLLAAGFFFAGARCAAFARAPAYSGPITAPLKPKTARAPSMIAAEMYATASG